MILFVFEGEDCEPYLYRTIERLYFPRDNGNIICSFGNNIYDLYNEMRSYDGEGDIVSVMQGRLAEKGDRTLENIRRTDISETFLFFDYDFHHSQLTLEEINRRVEEMLRMFDDETGNGRLYINYPMIESIRYTGELPDEKYREYVVTRAQSHGFKQLTHEFSFYRNHDHILFRPEESKPTKERYLTVKDNWGHLIEMNVRKANLLIGRGHSMPAEKSCIDQLDVFLNQRRLYVDPEESVAVLNAFPIFIYEYFRRL